MLYSWERCFVVQHSPEVKGFSGGCSQSQDVIDLKDASVFAAAVISNVHNTKGRLRRAQAYCALTVHFSFVMKSRRSRLSNRRFLSRIRLADRRPPKSSSFPGEAGKRFQRTISPWKRDVSDSSCEEVVTCVNLLLVVDLHDNELLTDGECGESGGEELAKPEGRNKSRLMHG